MKKFIKTLILVLLSLTIVLSSVACGKKDNYVVPPTPVTSQRESGDIVENPYGNAYRSYYLGEQVIKDFYQYNDGYGGALRATLDPNHGYGTGTGGWQGNAFNQMLMRLIALYPENQWYKDVFDDHLQAYYDLGMGPLNPYHDASKWAGKIAGGIIGDYQNGKKWDCNGFISWDDHVWSIRSFLDGFEVTGKEEYFTMAVNMCDLMIEDAYIPELEAFYWCDTSTFVAPISNAPFARELLKTYSLLSESEQNNPDSMVDGVHKYIYYAKKAYDWCMNTARNKSDGCFHDFAATNVACSINNPTDNIVIQGLNGKKFNYTSGSMISAAVWFYKITGEEKYLDEAVEMMIDMFEYFALPYEIDGYTYYYYPSEGNSQWMNSITLFGVYELSEYRYEDCLPVIKSFADGINYGFEHFLVDGYVSPYYLDGWMEDTSRQGGVKYTDLKDVTAMAEMFALADLAYKGIY